MPWGKLVFALGVLLFIVDLAGMKASDQVPSPFGFGMYTVACVILLVISGFIKDKKG